MTKDDLKSLVTEMYENLLENINHQATANTDDVIEYLRNSIHAVTSITDGKLDSIEEAKAAFNNAYQEIANKSISSYQHTNERFEALTQMHEKTLSDCKNEAIDVSCITKKFDDIQEHMIEEVKKANDIISKLSSQIATLEKDSTLDSLTKVFNRRALTKHLDHLCSQQKLNYELHLLILDIDDFKVINDTHGHIAGDKILIFVANILKKTLRDGDKIFRYGGEEFILILNRIDMLYCNKIASRILELISKNKLIYKGKSLSVTVSIGTTILVESDTPESLIYRADKALYKAKDDGKNRICTEFADGN